MTHVHTKEYFYLNEEELATLKKLENVERLISDLYTKIENLSEEELAQNKFDQLVAYLKVVLNLEEAQFRQANLTNELVYKYIEYTSIKNALVEFNDIESVLDARFEKRIYRRLITNLIAYNPAKKELVKAELEPEITQVITSLNLQDGKNIEPLKDNIIAYREALNNDMYYIFLGYIKTILPLINSEESKVALNATFYNMLFIYPELEARLLETNFIVKIPIENYHHQIETILPMNVYEDLRNSHCYTTALYWLICLLNITDADYSNNYYINRAYIYQCFIKSALILTNQETLIKIETIINDIIKSEEFKKEFPHNNISSTLALNLVNTVIEKQTNLKKDLC